MRSEIGTFEAFDVTMEKMRSDGILLVAGVPPNPMTIGWGTLGYIWSRPVFQVLVRPTRYTFTLMEQSHVFTVNILDDKYKKQLALCGSRSGSNTDKVNACGFTMLPGERTEAFFIGESTIHYECRIIHKHLLDESTIDVVLDKRYYPLKDYHMVYYGEVRGVFANYD